MQDMKLVTGTSMPLLCIINKFVNYIDGWKDRATIDSMIAFLYQLQERRGVKIYSNLKKWRKKDEIVDPIVMQDVAMLRSAGFLNVKNDSIILTRKGREAARYSVSACHPVLVDDKAIDVAIDYAASKYIIACRKCKAVIHFKWSWWFTRFDRGNENVDAGWCKCPWFHTLRASDFD